jgi:putative phosphoribosyl transferase
VNSFRFPNRSAAGCALAEQLRCWADAEPLVLALPRGGVPVGFEIARVLQAPLHVFLVRKLGVPGHEELAMGAIASGGTRVLNEEVLSRVRLSPNEIEAVAQAELVELERRERAFGGHAPPSDMQGRVCIVVDDGLATGSTMRAAIQALRQFEPERIIAAVPVAAADTCEALAQIADEAVCLYTPEPFVAVGRWYDDFSQLSDEEVRWYLDRLPAEVAR